jgi:drug/metabolite transporter (DMT)-like permease
LDAGRSGLYRVLVFSLAWAVLAVSTKAAYNAGAEPLSFIFQSISFAALCSLVYLAFSGVAGAAKSFKAFPLQLLAIGLVGGSLANLIGYFGLGMSTAINYSFLIKTTLIFTTALAVVFIGEPLGRKKVFLAVVLLVGSYLVSTKGELIVPHLGDLLIIVAAFCFSAAAVLSKSIMDKVTPEAMTAIRLISGSAGMFLLLPLIGANPIAANPAFFVVVAGVSQFFTSLYLNKTLEAASASYMTMMSMMMSVFAVVLAFVFLGETMAFVQVVGGLLIILAGVASHKLKM